MDLLISNTKKFLEVFDNNLLTFTYVMHLSTIFQRSADHLLGGLLLYSKAVQRLSNLGFLQLDRANLARSFEHILQELRWVKNISTQLQGNKSESKEPIHS